MLSDLPGNGCDPFLVIEQQHIAVTSHQLQDQSAHARLARAWSEMKQHNPLKVSLLQFHQGQLPEAVLNLLSQSAATPNPAR